MGTGSAVTPEVSNHAVIMGHELADGGTFAGGVGAVEPCGQPDSPAPLWITPAISITAEAFNVTDACRIEDEGINRVVRHVGIAGGVLQAGGHFAA